MSQMVRFFDGHLGLEWVKSLKPQHKSMRPTENIQKLTVDSEKSVNDILNLK